MFYIIGIGLHDEKDITVKGLEIVKSAKRVYLEMYTSIIGRGKDELEKYYGCDLLLADRELVESNSDEIFKDADKEDVVFLVAGDPFCATTHTDLMLRAHNRSIKTQIVHNASIINAVGCCGLELYKFGETVSIPYWTEGWKPDSFCGKIIRNISNGLHTLCLLDIQVKEPTLDSIFKKKKKYLPPRFMSVKEAALQILQAVEDFDTGAITPNTQCVGLARVGSDTQKIVTCSLERMTTVDLGKPLHSLIIVGVVHHIEEEFLKQFNI